MARLYEYTVNAENKIDVDKSTVDNVYIGNDTVYSKIVSMVKDFYTENKKTCVIGFDGNYCVNWAHILSDLEKALSENGINFTSIHINRAFQTKEFIREYKRPNLEYDPSLGYENQDGLVQDIMDMDKLSLLKKELEDSKNNSISTPSLTVVYAPGSCVKEIIDTYDYSFYFDMTKDPIMWNMWDNTLIPFGYDEPDPNYYWKELYYVDFHLLDNQKWFMLDNMDFYIEAVEPDNLTLITYDAYTNIINRLLDYPVKQVKIFMPGSWGAYRFKQLWDVPGLDNSAWNTIASPKLDMIIDIGKKQIRLPSVNLLQYGDRFVGKYWDAEVPKWWPLLVAIDDGYFEDPDVPMERTAMPHHNHPSTEYIRRNFNEQFGRYETYYILEAYENAATMMGFKDDANIDEWREKCWAASEKKELVENWRDYIKVWKTAPGDLFLIPPGTTHGHGGRQMVLEMDTNTNTTTCEYSFFMHDFGRHSWDDTTKTMTNKPSNLQCKHGFNVDQARRESWVRDNLRARPEVIKWTPEYYIERFSSLPEMPFHIERLRFTSAAEYDTEGKYLHVITLTIGEKITIRSKLDPKRETTLDFLQAANIPADFGPYELINNTSGECTVMLIRMKKG